MKILNTSKDFYSAVGKNDFEVHFEKESDGELRILQGTCNKEKILNLLPKKKAAALANNKTKKKLNQEVVVAFDLEANDWRSFRVDSLTKVDIKPR